MKHVLILGAASDLARALAREFASRGFSLHLAARDCQRLEPLKADLGVRYSIDVQLHEYDAADMDEQPGFMNGLSPLPDGVITCVGYLGDQQEAQGDPDKAAQIMLLNYNAIVASLEPAAGLMEKRGNGFIIAVSSVAGDRGRASNYFYGSAKAGLTAYLSGLRNRLASVGVNVLTVKPGFLDTAMTAGMDLPPALTASPEEAAADIAKAYDKGRHVIYTKWMWRYIMLIIKNIPEFIFKKLSL